MDAPVSRPLCSGRLHGITAGPEDGPLVILLHGFPDFSWGWRRQIGPLAAAGYRVIAPDQRGYRHSDKPRALAAYHLDRLAADVLEIAESCGRTSFRLAGHDWGGVVAWWTAAHFAPRVEQLVILNAPHPAVWRAVWRRNWRQALKSWYAAFFQLPRLPEALLRAGDYALLRRALQKSSRPGTFSENDFAHYRAAWAEPGALTAMLNYYRALRLRRSAEPVRIKPPTLLIWGEQDDFLEKATALESLTLCVQGRGLFLPEAGHWALLEEPQKVNSAILRFFSEGTASAEPSRHSSSSRRPKRARR